MNLEDFDPLFRATPGLAAITSMTWLLARTFLNAENRRDNEYQRLTKEIERKDSIILRLETQLEIVRERNPDG